MSAQNLCVEKDVENINFLSLLFDEQQLTFSNIFNKLNFTRRNDRTDDEKDDDFLIFEELLLDVKKAQEKQRTDSSDEHSTRKSEDNFEHIVKNDRNSVDSFRASENKNENEYISFICCWKQCWRQTEKSMSANNNRSENCDVSDAQREIDDSIYVKTCNNLIADEENKKKEVVRSDQCEQFNCWEHVWWFKISQSRFTISTITTLTSFDLSLYETSRSSYSDILLIWDLKTETLAQVRLWINLTV